MVQSDIKSAIRDRRKAENKLRSSKSGLDFLAFKSAHYYATRVMNDARCQYYIQLIAENSSDQKKIP